MAVDSSFTAVQVLDILGLKQKYQAKRTPWDPAQDGALAALAELIDNLRLQAGALALAAETERRILQQGATGDSWYDDSLTVLSALESRLLDTQDQIIHLVEECDRQFWQSVAELKTRSLAWSHGQVESQALLAHAAGDMPRYECLADVLGMLDYAKEVYRNSSRQWE